MTTAILLLLLVGAGDLLRGLRPRALGGGLAAVVVLGLAAAAVWGLDAPLPGAAAAAAAAVLWMIAVPLEKPRLWPVPLLLAAVAAAVVLDGSAPAGALADWLAASPLPVGPASALAVLAAGLVLTRTANLAVRAALDFARAGSDGDAPPEGAGNGWVLRLGQRRIGSVEPWGDDAAADSPSGLQLLGGRVIGPLERLLFLGLFLIDAQAVVVALLAAKGIVRFPEISADRGKGSKAEEFLIGSLTSWALALAGVLFVKLVG